MSAPKFPHDSSITGRRSSSEGGASRWRYTTRASRYSEDRRDSALAPSRLQICDGQSRVCDSVTTMRYRLAEEREQVVRVVLRGRQRAADRRVAGQDRRAPPASSSRTASSCCGTTSMSARAARSSGSASRRCRRLPSSGRSPGTRRRAGRRRAWRTSTVAAEAFTVPGKTSCSTFELKRKRTRKTSGAAPRIVRNWRATRTRQAATATPTPMSDSARDQHRRSVDAAALQRLRAEDARRAPARNT